MNRETFRKLVGNEIVNVNKSYEGVSSGRQGQIKKIKSKKDGLVQVEFQGRKTPATYHYKFLDVVEEEVHEETKEPESITITIPKMETSVVVNTPPVTGSNVTTMSQSTEASEVEEKDEASTSTETGN